MMIILLKDIENLNILTSKKKNLKERENAL